MNNSAWAHAIIDQLILQNVRDFCIAPGSRSTPLALAAARHPKAAVHVHFDERGLGFFALGLSLASRLPTALIATSGTAVGNLLPSAMEAYHSQIPLVFLTADRPPESHDCGANQTADQIGIFSRFALWQTDLPCPDSHLVEEFARSQIAYAIFQASRGGPVHLNCRFREPLFSFPEPQKFGTSQSFFSPELSPTPSCVEHFETRLNQAKRGVIVIGRMSAFADLSAIAAFAKRLRWPIFADILSQMRTYPEPEESIRYFDYAVQSDPAPQPDFIVHFGGPILSQSLLRWIKRANAPVFHISQYPCRIDPLHCLPTRIWADPELFCRAVSASSKEEAWLSEWKQIDRQIDGRLEEHFAAPHPFSEADLMRTLRDCIPAGWSAFFANSMPIRDAAQFFFPPSIDAIFANRGVSGIDGQIATAAGIAKKLNRPMLAVLGDQSCLHDLNSLALLRSLNTPFVLVASNNFGGGIFSHLPVSKEPEHFETLFSASHPFCFEGAARMFNLPYRSALRADADIFAVDRPSIVEILSSRSDSAQFHKQFLRALAPS